MIEPKKSVAIMFTNWTKEDFTHKWDSVEYSFKSGDSTLLQDYLAHHFAKHLAQREVNKIKDLQMNSREYQEFYDKCLGTEKVEAETNLKLEMKMKEKEPEEKKDGKLEKARERMAKAREAKKNKAIENKPEDEFAGIKKDEASK